MHDNGRHARHKRCYKVTADSKHGLPVVEKLLVRNFTPMAPNPVWTSDITYLWTDEGWLYLVIVLDLFNREIVGWSLKPRMTADIVTDALTTAGFRKRPAPRLLHHSDRGSQYASHVFQDKLKAYGMTCSMSRKGNCWDTQTKMPFERWADLTRAATGSTAFALTRRQAAATGRFARSIIAAAAGVCASGIKRPKNTPIPPPVRRCAVTSALVSDGLARAQARSA